MAVDLTASQTAMIERMETSQAQSLEATTQTNEKTNEFNTKMQALKMEHSSNKAAIDALKAAANNVAQMGRAQ